MGIRMENLKKLTNGLNEHLSGSGFNYPWTGKNGKNYHAFESSYLVLNEYGHSKGIINFQVVLDFKDLYANKIYKFRLHGRGTKSHYLLKQHDLWSYLEDEIFDALNKIIEEKIK